MSDPLPPTNLSLRWFRVVVWIMPVCLAYATLVLVGRLLPNPATASVAYLWGWLGVNIALTLCLGLLDQKLGDPKASFKEAIPRLAGFLLLQLLIVPVILVVTLMAKLHVD